MSYNGSGLWDVRHDGYAVVKVFNKGGEFTYVKGELCSGRSSGSGMGWSYEDMSRCITFYGRIRYGRIRESDINIDRVSFILPSRSFDVLSIRIKGSSDTLAKSFYDNMGKRAIDGLNFKISSTSEFLSCFLYHDINVCDFLLLQKLPDNTIESSWKLDEGSFLKKLNKEQVKMYLKYGNGWRNG